MALFLDEHFDLNNLFDTKQWVYPDKKIGNLKGIDLFYTEKVPVSEAKKLDENPNYRVLDPNNVYKTKYTDGVYFGVLYKSNHLDSYGDEFFVTSVVRIKNKDLNKYKTKYFLFITVSFVHTGRTIKVSEKLFKSRYIYNPYHLKFFGCCSIGNIDILEHKEDFYCWYEAINKCYDPTCISYGFAVNLPVLCTFNCFETFVKFNETQKRRGLPYIHDPNDRYLYMCVHPSYDMDSYRNTSMLTSLKYTSTAYPYTKLTIDENYTPIEERKDSVYREKHAGGRPAANASSYLNDQNSESTESKQGKKLMYRLIDKNDK